DRAIITPQLRRRFALSLLFGLLVVTALAFIGDAPRVIAAARHFAWAYVPAVLALTAFNYLLRGVTWQYYLRLIGARVSVGAVAVVQSRPLSLRILTALEGVPVLAPRAHHLRAFYESAYVLLSWRPLLVALAIGVVSWSGECVAFFLILAGLGFPPTPGLLIR